MDRPGSGAAALSQIGRGQPGAGGFGLESLSQGELARSGPLGLYVHFPFCSVRCPYCDFAIDVRTEIPHDAYADAVIAELTARATWFRGTGGEAAPALASIYFGGGTPGLWRPDALGRVIATARALFAAGDQPLEITVEANPGEVDSARLGALRANGVNRLSLGLQSLDDRLLHAIGRNHDAAAGVAAVRAGREAGFANLSVDLMFALPGQSFDDWRATIDQVLALAPDHVSAYALTIENGTRFGRRARAGELVVPDDEQAAAMQTWGRDALAASGLAQYEVSSYAREGQRAIHNSLYWTRSPYLGVGVSAASFRPLSDGSGWRFSNSRSTPAYLRQASFAGGPPPAQVEKRNRADLENEAVWLALRTTDGLDLARHEKWFAVNPITSRQKALDLCVDRGWLQVGPSRLAPTPEGLLFADDIAARLWL